jgi:hypothetical protein
MKYYRALLPCGNAHTALSQTGLTRLCALLVVIDSFGRF